MCATHRNQKSPDVACWRDTVASHSLEALRAPRIVQRWKDLDGQAYGWRLNGEDQPNE